jgi:hypothetical protein
MRGAPDGRRWNTGSLAAMSHNKSASIGSTPAEPVVLEPSPPNSGYKADKGGRYDYPGARQSAADRRG